MIDVTEIKDALKNHPIKKWRESKVAFTQSFFVLLFTQLSLNGQSDYDTSSDDVLAITLLMTSHLAFYPYQDKLNLHICLL